MEGHIQQGQPKLPYLPNLNPGGLIALDTALHTADFFFVARIIISSDLANRNNAIPEVERS